MEALPSSACLIFIALALGSIVTTGAVQGGVFKELTTPLGHQIMRLAKSAEMRSFIDTSVSPCDDFYGYACGHYASINAATPDKDTNIGQVMFASYLRRARQILNQPRMSSDRPMETRVKYFYESCLDTATLEVNQRSQLLNVLREFGGMPAVEGSSWDEFQFDPLETMAQLLRRYGKLTLLGVYVAPDFTNSQINRLYLGQRDDLDVRDEATSLAKKLELTVRLQEQLGLSEQLARKTADEIIDLEAELSRSVLDRGMDRDPRLRSRLTMLSNMTDAYGPALNLTRFVSLWLGHDYILPVYENVPGYLFQLKKTLLTTSNRVLANYMLSSLLRDFEIQADAQKQEEICAERITMLFPDVVDHLVYYSLEQQSPHLPTDLKLLWIELKTVFEDMLSSEELDWLDEKTRGDLVEKLKSMNFEVAGEKPVNFEERYGSLVISSADYYGNVRRLLANQAGNLRSDLMRDSRTENYYDGIIGSPFYLTEANLVVLPASYMQHRYFWDDVYPVALKYGTLGFILSHEMAHGFDDLSRLYDSKGNLHDTWSSQATVGFNLIKDCLVEQFSEMRYSNLRLPKMEAQGENIADNVGIRISQAAYRKWLEQAKTLDSEALPHMSQTPEQLFYLGVGQLMCSDILFDRRPAFLRNSAHPPHESRVFAIMSNSQSFAEAFQCGNQTKMNPPHRCLMY
ncbi:hypothetical protein KR059_001074 [Drosophila kikkawai]|nr:hypothetical protein KR059_001074 [Drosophila kikkawai]